MAFDVSLQTRNQQAIEDALKKAVDPDIFERACALADIVMNDERAYGNRQNALEVLIDTIRLKPKK